MGLTQAELNRHMEVLIKNGKLPQVEPVFTSVGYGPEELDVGAQLLHTWRDRQAQAKTLLYAQKAATQAEHAARAATEKEVSDFKATARALFRDNELVLSLLGLSRRRSYGSVGTVETDPLETEENGTGEDGNGNGNGYARSTSRSTAAVITSAQQLFANALRLGEAELTLLARAGWDVERMNAAVEQIEAYVVAETAQLDAMQAYLAERTAVREAEAELRRWRSQLVKLIRVALKRLDPDNRERLEMLLML